MIALPFAILTLVPRLERIPASLEEASRDLGAGWFTTFRQITWPLLLPAVFSAFLLSFVISFDEIVLASFVAGDQVDVPRVPVLAAAAAPTAAAGDRGGRS